MGRAFNGVRPVNRYLRGYSLDPGFSTRLDTAGINEVVYRVPFEDLAPGPVGEYIEVLDFDPASDCWYEPVDLSDERIASQHGIAPSEGSPQFHQQFVYAVAMKTIRHFERALGRKIVWYPRLIGPARRASEARRWDREYVARLRIYPHGLRDANAYYDPDKAALLFGYFTAADKSQGTNYPGGLVFTCLSPDIVAHETTHAILDSIHHRYMEDTNPDVAGFHEGFADIVALLQRFTFGDLIEHQLFASGGRLDRYNVLGELATQFGEALEGNRGALRHMIGQWNEKGEWEPIKPDPSDYRLNVEAHDRGAVLVATMFDVFRRVYEFRTADLFRLAGAGSSRASDGSINRDLLHRLAGEASEIAEHLLHICIRALDYCPPNDITFGNYLRALVTADLDIAPEDENGYRLALIEAFRARGIFPTHVNILSIESLCWDHPDFTDRQVDVVSWLITQIKEDITGLMETVDRRELYERSQKAQAKLNAILMGKAARHGPYEWEQFLNELGLTSRPVSELFGKDSRKVRFLFEDKPNNTYVPKIEVHTIRPAFRAGREGRQVQQVVITLTQRVTVDIGEDGQRRVMVFRGGCSMILSLGNLNAVEYVILKDVKGYDRFCRQERYLTGEDQNAASPPPSLYSDDDRSWRLDFNLLHRH